MTVTALANPGAETFRKSIAEFRFKAETADVALVYFAGHGMEVGGRNFLIPADSRARSREEAAQGALTLDEVLAAVDRARHLRIVILDSCRDDPFLTPGTSDTVTLPAGQGPSEGLAPPSPDRGTLVAYAAKDGKVAIDGLGRNSPFALALARNLGTPDLEIGLMFRRVRDDVLRATSNFQEPHVYGSLSARPYFLAGRNQAANRLEETARKTAWARLDFDQQAQLAALAEQGDLRAQKGLAQIRLNPDGPAYDPAAGAQLLQGAADQGDAEARYELGLLHERGIGVDQDIARALALYRQAAEADFPDALNDLGFLYFQGGSGVARNPALAAEFFQRAAALRHPEAMFNTAALIDDGLIAGKAADDAAALLYDALRVGNEDVLRTLSEDPAMFKPQTRSALQRKLAERGFYGGAIDGQFGPQTQRGLRRAFGLGE